MPSTYAHYRMGREVAEELTGEAWHTLSMYRQLYLIGLHGPDILFYYKPLKSNAINGIGYGMHGRPGIEFFEHAVKVIENKDNKAPYLAYMYGVMCHFALDVTCHGYIDEKIEQYIADIVFASRYPDRYGMPELKDMMTFGGSPRASINLAKAARAYAFIKHRGYVVPEDVRAVAHDVMRHRIGLSYEAEASNVTSEDIVSKIINKVEVP